MVVIQVELVCFSKSKIDNQLIFGQNALQEVECGPTCWANNERTLTHGQMPKEQWSSG